MISDAAGRNQTDKGFNEGATELTKRPGHSSQRRVAKKSARKVPTKVASNIRRPRGNSVVLRAWISRGYSHDDIDKAEMPKQLLAAKRAWRKNDPKARALVTPFLCCFFLPGNIQGDISKILRVEDHIEADSITVSDADFSNTNLPRISASAHFTVQSVDKLDQTRLDKWQEKNDMLYWGISFEWRFDGLDEMKFWAIWDYRALGVELVQAPPRAKIT